MSGFEKTKKAGRHVVLAAGSGAIGAGVGGGILYAATNPLTVAGVSASVTSAVSAIGLSASTLTLGTAAAIGVSATTLTLGAAAIVGVSVYAGVQLWRLNRTKKEKTSLM